MSGEFCLSWRSLFKMADKTVSINDIIQEQYAEDQALEYLQEGALLN